MAQHHGHTHSAVGNIKVAFFLNLGFTIFEIIGGIWTNSVAILADAVHDLGDSVSLGFSWFLEHYAQKGKSKKYSYGYRRFSLLGALINAVILVGGTLFILSETIPRLMQPEQTNAPGMVVFAVVGILVNGSAVLRLRNERGMNAQIVAWHLLEDVLGWVVILLVSIILLFRDIPILDPLLSILITLYILYNVIRNLRRTLALFLQAVPDYIDLEDLEERMQAIAGVHSTHHTHVWSLDGEHHVLTTHVVVDPEMSRAEVICVKEQIVELTRDLHFEHITIEVEHGTETCSMQTAGDLSERH